jgi:hypothetical protein
MRRAACALLVAVSSGLAIVACGSSGKSSNAGAKPGRSAFLAFSVCMRSHGVPKFPDPGSSGGIHLTLGSGIDPQSPAFQSAQQHCRKLLPGGGPRPLTAADKAQLLANARCMREHGLPNFPDPIFPPGGGVEMQLQGINPNSPAFQHAAKACGGPTGTVRIG